MAKHKGHKGHHTGKIRHHDMAMHNSSKGLGGKDPHASAEHHAANKAHGMPEGLSPVGGYDSDEESEQGGEGMADNEECCE